MNQIIKANIRSGLNTVTEALTKDQKTICVIVVVSLIYTLLNNAMDKGYNVRFDIQNGIIELKKEDISKK